MVESKRPCRKLVIARTVSSNILKTQTVSASLKRWPKSVEQGCQHGLRQKIAVKWPIGSYPLRRQVSKRPIETRKAIVNYNTNTLNNQLSFTTNADVLLRIGQAFLAHNDTQDAQTVKPS